jgi:hypothetical protein
MCSMCHLPGWRFFLSLPVHACPCPPSDPARAKLRCWLVSIFKHPWACSLGVKYGNCYVMRSNGYPALGAGGCASSAKKMAGWLKITTGQIACARYFCAKATSCDAAAQPSAVR